MAGGCLSCFFAYTSVVLLGGRLYDRSQTGRRCQSQDVEASRCDGVIYKKVGDTVELPSCAPTKGVTDLEWKYGFNLIVEEKTVYENNQFKGRLNLNPTSFNLTVRQLTRQDSGVFQFISDVNGTQSETVTINLKVYDPITKEPDVTLDSSWDAENNSCTVSLTCSSTSDSSVTFSWTVRNETTSGSTMDYNVTPQDGDTGFTCTVSNVVSEKSKSITAKCSNATTNESDSKSSSSLVIPLGAAGGACLMVVVAVGVAVCVCHRKQSPAVGGESNDNTLYADIHDVAISYRNPSTMEPSTVYETVDKVDPLGPQTVYDKIQFSRMRKPSVSPYQEVS